MLSSFRRLSRNSVVLAASVGAVLTAFFSWNALLPLHLRALGATDVEISVAFSMFILFHTVPAVAGGMLADRFGRKWIAIGPGLILSPLYILAGLATDWRLLSFILICTNMVGAAQWPAMQAMISESDEETRATAFSLIEIFVLSAAVIGPLLGSFLLPFVGVGGLMILDGLTLAAATWVRARQLRETHAPAARTNWNWDEGRAAITRPVAWIFASFALASLALGLSAAGPFMAIMAHDSWGLDDQQVQQLISLTSLGAFGGVWLGSRADQWGDRRTWMIAAAGFALTLVGWALSPSALVGAWFMAGNNLFFEAVFIISETLLAQHTVRRTRSFLFGLQGTLGGLAEGAGPTIGGGLVERWRLPATFLVGALVGLLSLAALMPVREPVSQAVAPIPAE